MIMRLIRLPFFVITWLIGFFGIFFVVGATTIGGWLEVILRPLGYKGRVHAVPIVLGSVVFIAAVVVAPAMIGIQLLGWPGAGVGPLLMLGVLAVLGRW